MKKILLLAMALMLLVVPALAQTVTFPIEDISVVVPDNIVVTEEEQGDTAEFYLFELPDAPNTQFIFAVGIEEKEDTEDYSSLATMTEEEIVAMVDEVGFDLHDATHEVLTLGANPFLVITTPTKDEIIYVTVVDGIVVELVVYAQSDDDLLTNDDMPLSDEAILAAKTIVESIIFNATK